MYRMKLLMISHTILINCILIRPSTNTCRKGEAAAFWLQSSMVASDGAVIAFAYTHHIAVVIFLYWRVHKCPSSALALSSAVAITVTVDR